MLIHCFFVFRALGARLHHHTLRHGFRALHRAHYAIRHALAAPARGAAIKVCVATGLAGLGAAAPPASIAHPPISDTPLGYSAAPAAGFGAGSAPSSADGGFGFDPGSFGGSPNPSVLFGPAATDASPNPVIFFSPDGPGGPPPAFDPPPTGGWPVDPPQPIDPRGPPDPPGSRTTPPAVPEPSSLHLLAAALLAGAGSVLWRRHAPVRARD